MTTLRQVAELAGVSIGTASVALNSGQVKESTRRRVIESANQLNYVPNQIGRALNTGKSNTIALLIMTSLEYVDIVQHTSLSYYHLQGVLSVVNEADYGLRVDVKAHEDPDLLDYFDRVVGNRILDGIIIVPLYLCDYSFLYILQRRGFPYVMMRPARFGKQVNYFDPEHYHGGQLVARLFGKRGYRRVAMINGPGTHVDAIEREHGFVAGLIEVGIQKLTKRYGDFTIQSGSAAMEEILKELRPDAVFCANDYMAAGAMKALARAGAKVPDDVAIVGYDNTDICDALVPSLTTVDYRAKEVGQCLARELLALIGGKVKSVKKSVQPFLVERESH